jgi:hypothetical protein
MVGSLTACTGSNVRPGDFEYPVANHEANKVLSIVGRMPRSLDVKLIAKFSPKDGGIYNPTTGGLVCGYAVGLGAHTPYTVDVPISIERSGEVYSASILIDKFQEGKCGWHLFAISYSASKASIATRPGQYNMDPIRAMVDRAPFNRQRDNNVFVKVSKSCVVDFNEVDKLFLNCELLPNNRFLETIAPEDKEFHQAEIFLKPQTIEINFNYLPSSLAND